MAQQARINDWLFALVAWHHGLIEAEQLQLLGESQAGVSFEQSLERGGLLTPAVQRLIRRRIEERAGHSADAERAIGGLIREQSVRDALLCNLPPAVQDEFRELCRRIDALEEEGLEPEFWDLHHYLRSLRFHARGGMGTISIAEDLALSRQVAVKELARGLEDNKEARLRFVREAEVTGLLEHPGVVPIYGLGTQSDGRPFYSMRFVQGTTLETAISEFHETLPDNRARFRSKAFRQLLRHFIDVCNTMEYAHRQGILHRDLKPANIMLGQCGETLVLDWGLAHTTKEEVAAHGTLQAVELGPADSGAEESFETGYGKMMGTPLFAAPEQLRGHLDRLGPGTDVYSLGVILYLILTGEVPFSGTKIQQVVAAALAGEYPAVTKTNRFAPRPLAAVCHRAMSLRPEDRYASARELGEEIEHWHADEPVLAYRESIGERSGRWLRKHRGWATSGFAAICLVAFVSSAAALLVFTFWREAELARARLSEAKRATELQRDVAVRQEQLARLSLYNAQLMQIEDLALRRPYRARRLLMDATRCPSALREFTWGYLQAQLSRPGALSDSQHDGVTAIALSEDGSLLYSVGESPSLLVWDTSTGERLDDRPVKAAGSGAVACTRAGNVVAFAVNEKCVRLEFRDASSASLESEDVGGPIEELVFSQDGSLLAIGTSSGTVLIYSWETDGLKAPRVSQVIDEGSAVTGLGFFDQDRVLCIATGMGNRRVHFFDRDRNTLLEPSQVTGSLTNISALACARAAPRLVSWSDERGLLEIWEFQRATASLVTRIDEKRLPKASSVSISSDGTVVCYGDSSGSIGIWNVGQDATEFLAHAAQVTSLQLSHDATILASIDRDGAIRVWNLSELQDNTRTSQRRSIARGDAPADRLPIFSMASAADGHLLATGGVAGTVELWGTNPWHRLRTAGSHPNFINTIHFAPNGRWLASRCDVGILIVWAIDDNVEVARLQSLDVEAFQFAPDEPLLRLSLRDGSVKEWNFRESPAPGDVAGLAELIPRHASGNHARTIACGSKKLWLSFTFGGEGIQLLSADGNQIDGAITVGGGVATREVEPIAVSAGGDYVAVQTAEHIEVWDLASMACNLRQEKEPGIDYLMRFSPDARTFISVPHNYVDATVDGTKLTFWDPVTGQQRIEQLAGNSRILAVEFLNDGSAIVVSDENGGLTAWNSTLPTDLESTRRTVVDD